MHAFPTARDGHIPLLRVCGAADGRVAEEHVVHGFSLRAVRCNRVTADELPVARGERPPVGEFDLSRGADVFHGDDLSLIHI